MYDRHAIPGHDGQTNPPVRTDATVSTGNDATTDTAIPDAQPLSLSLSSASSSRWRLLSPFATRSYE